MLQTSLKRFFDNNTVEEQIVKIQEDKYGVKWALTKHGPVCGEDVENAKCYGCYEPLSFIKEHDSRRNGISHRVKSYYRHAAKQGGNCSGESIAHRAAKHAILTHFREWTFKYCCYYCKRKKDIDFGDVNESTAKEEVTWKDYRLDVGILKNNKVTGCIEVFKTHPLSEEKINDLTNSGLPWCEVSAQQILDSLERGESEIVVGKCAADVCCYCANTEKKRCLETLRLEYKKKSEEWQTKIKEQAFRDFKQSKELIENNTLQDELEKLQKDMDMSQKECLQIALKESKEKCHQIETLKKCIIERNQEVLCKSHEFCKHREIQDKWEEYKKHIISYAAKVARDLKLPEKESELYTMKIIEGEDVLGNMVLTFGKYKGGFLEDLLDNDFKYLLWLAGFDWGRTSEKCRPLKRPLDSIGAEFIPKHVEQKARQLVQGLCFACAEDLGNNPGEEWKTFCKSCFSEEMYKKNKWT